MSAQSRRLSFASPLVVTSAFGLAAMASMSCKSAPAPAAKPTAVGPVAPNPMPPTANPPPPEPAKPAAPPPIDPAQTPLPEGATRWIAHKQADGACYATHEFHCPPMGANGIRPTCNPPPPAPIDCPPELTVEQPIAIIRYSGSTTCTIERAPFSCPPNVACNPPPPQHFKCPTH